MKKNPGMKTEGESKSMRRSHARVGATRVRGRVWIEGAGGTFLGFGRVVLLERIERTGSISRAARSMNMSYRKAWLLVDSMNRQSAEPLVTTATGGRGGGGARLTGAGKKAIETFRDIWGRMEKFMARQTARLKL